MTRMLFIVGFAILVLAGCSPVKKAVLNMSDKNHYQVGFYLYDPISKKDLVDINSDKYFTPASNTKVYTFYSVLNTLPDSIPAFRYVSTDSMLYVWGLAEPSFLNPNLPQGNTYEFLHAAQRIGFSGSNLYSKRFGSGWAWDDYSYSYSQERTSFPIYGNSVIFNIDSLSRELEVIPAIFSDSVTIVPGERYGVSRNEFNNQFEWDTTACENCKRIRPIYFTSHTFQSLLEDTLKVPVTITPLALPDTAETFYSIPTDSVLKVMMQESDNFMAEHLLMSCAAQLTDSLSTEVGIEHMSKKINAIVPNPIVWKDGSGLSRYNLFTPRDMVFLWDHLYNNYGQERLFSLISAGGVRGTLKNWFVADPPYIYGKTGTLSNNFNLSGFLITKSGRRLAFAYMNNNYPMRASDIKKEMEVVLRKVYEKY